MPYKREKFIVLTDYNKEEFSSDWGAIGKPILNNGNWILPLGWEAELDKVKIAYEVKEVEYYYEDII